MSLLVAMAGVIEESSSIMVGVPWKRLTLSFEEEELINIKLLFALNPSEKMVSAASVDRNFSSYLGCEVVACSIELMFTGVP